MNAKQGINAEYMGARSLRLVFLLLGLVFRIKGRVFSFILFSFFRLPKCLGEENPNTCTSLLLLLLLLLDPQFLFLSKKKTRTEGRKGSLAPPPPAMESTALAHVDNKESMVDPFLVEALQNPRHRLTILRMELDIQKFLHNQDQLQFEFQHFPTSYLRLAAHRTAQHYGMQTMVQDNGLDGLGSKILVTKTAESKYPAVRLSDIPAKQSENDKPEHVKIAIRHRPNRASGSDGNDGEVKRGFLRSVEERKEEYDKARARIFSSPSSPQADDAFPQVPTDGKNICLSKDDYKVCRNNGVDLENSFSMRDGGSSSRVAIFRDREKDRTDPDYDRSYERYTRNIPINQSFNLVPFSMQKFPFVQYETGFSQLGHIPRTQPSIGYRPPSNPVMSPFSAGGLTQTSTDAAYMQWPSATMMYAHSYDQFRHGVFQAPFCQQPLSFDYSQNL